MAATVQAPILLTDRQRTAVTIPTAGPVVAVQLTNGMAESTVLLELAPGLVDQLAPNDSVLYLPANYPAYSGVVFLTATSSGTLPPTSSGQLTLTTFTTTAPDPASVGARPGQPYPAFASMHDAWSAVRPMQPFNVRDYGAIGDGMTDDTAAIQAALDAASGAGGGQVTLPRGTSLLSTTLTIRADNVEIVGAGWASQLLALPGFPAGPMIQALAPGGGVFRYGIRLAHFYVNGNQQAGVSGLDLQSTYFADLDHLRVRFCPVTGINMDGSSGNTGAYNHIRECVVTDSLACIQTNFSEWLSIIGGLVGYNNGIANSVGVKIGNLNCTISGVQFDMINTGIELDFAGRNIITGCQFDNTKSHAIYMNGPQYCVVTGNSFNQFTGVAAGQGAIQCVNGNSAGNVISGNTLKSGSNWPFFIQEDASTPANGYLYTGNALPVGTLLNLVKGIARGNQGYNPVGKLAAQPAVPASGTALVNPGGADCTVYVTGGTVSAVSIGGQATGLTSPGAFRVPAGQSITLTYSAAPTWIWFGD